MISAPDFGSSPADDDDWGAAPTHPEAGETPASGAEGAGANHDWDPAPPLPLGIPKAPKAERRPKQVKRRGERRGPRSAAKSSDDAPGLGAEDRPPRESKADRPPPTAEERLQLALKHAYRYLAKRDRTVAEVRAHLVKRETDPASLEAAVAELLELRYLDDARYVQRYVEDRRRLDGWGPVRITQGLRKMGIDPPLIEPAIAAVSAESEDDDVTLATDLVHRRFNRRPLDGDKDRQKALRAVVSKGHTLDVAYAAVRAYEERCAADADR
ncbi:MAG: RecX family transcriptional regulator [Patulibacter sp.]|nr:RecX family transcriptional regulator [Patulibacter sp.]